MAAANPWRLVPYRDHTDVEGADGRPTGTSRHRHLGTHELGRRHERLRGRRCTCRCGEPQDRQRAGKTSLQREGTTDLLLITALPGSVILQRRGTDGTWETLDKRPASRGGRTRIELPQEAASSPPNFRVMFAPKNANITSWISENIDG